MRPSSIGPWTTSFLLLVLGIALLFVGAVTSVAIVVLGAIVVMVAFARGLYYGEKSAGEMQRQQANRRRRKLG